MNPEVMGVLRELTEPSTDDINNVLESQTGAIAHHNETGEVILEGQPWQLSIAEALLIDKYNATLGDEAVVVKGSGKTNGKYIARSSTVLEKDIDISMTDDSTSHDNLIIQESIQPNFMHTTNMSKTVMKEPSDVSDESTSEVSMPPEWAQVKLRKTVKSLENPVSDSTNGRDVVIPAAMLPTWINSIRSSVDLQDSNESTSEFVKPPEWAKVSLKKTVPHARDDFSIQESERFIATQPGSVRKSISMFEGKDMEAIIPLKRTPSMKKPPLMPKPRIKIPVVLFTRPATTGQNSISFPKEDDVTSPAGIVQTLETAPADELFVNTGTTFNAGTELNPMETSGDVAFALQTLCELDLEITPSSENISLSSSRHNSSISDTTESSTFPDSPHNTSSSSSAISDTISLQNDLADLDHTKSSDIEECPFCTEICDEPVRLKCVHSICSACLQRYYAIYLYLRCI